jgi:hypothetical protein
MNAQRRLSELSEGFAFPPEACRLGAVQVSAYLKAVDETGDLYRDGRLVPPMAVAASAMTSLLTSMSVPPGTVHVSQEFQFLNMVYVGDSLTCRATIGRKLDRGRLHLMTVDIDVRNQDQKVVLTGKVGFALPENGWRAS